MYVSPWYTVESSLHVALCVILGLVLLFQFISESYAPFRVVSVKKLFHRIGLIIVGLNAVRCIDLHALYGILPEEVVGAISANVTFLVLCCVCAALYYVISAHFGLSLSGKPLRLKTALLCCLLVTLVFVNASYVVMAVIDREWPRGVVYLWWALSFGLSVSATVISVGRLRSSLVEMLADPVVAVAPKQDAQMKQSLFKLLLLQLFGVALLIFACTSATYFGVLKVSDTEAHVQHADPLRFEAASQMQLWAQWVCLVVFTWWAWIPLYYCFPAADTLDSKRQPFLSDAPRHHHTASRSQSRRQLDYDCDSRGDPNPNSYGVYGATDSSALEPASASVSAEAEAEAEADARSHLEQLHRNDVGRQRASTATSQRTDADADAAERSSISHTESQEDVYSRLRSRENSDLSFSRSQSLLQSQSQSQPQPQPQPPDPEDLEAQARSAFHSRRSLTSRGYSAPPIAPPAPPAPSPPHAIPVARYPSLSTVRELSVAASPTASQGSSAAASAVGSFRTASPPPQSQSQSRSMPRSPLSMLAGVVAGRTSPAPATPKTPVREREMHSPVPPRPALAIAARDGRTDIDHSPRVHPPPIGADADADTESGADLHRAS